MQPKLEAQCAREIDGNNGNEQSLQLKKTFLLFHLEKGMTRKEQQLSAVSAVSVLAKTDVFLNAEIYNKDTVIYSM